MSRLVLCLALATSLVACRAQGPVETESVTVPPQNVATATPTPSATPTEQPTPTQTPEPTSTTTPTRTAVRAASGGGGGLSTCQTNPERYEWKKYALLVGFPPEVVDGELEHIIKNESNGDLCAVNSSSGATCWIQQVPGGPQYFDPITCMSIGYAKWVDGGRDFWRHWYQWWQ